MTDRDARVLQIIRDLSTVNAEPQREQDLELDLGLDSLDVVQLAMQLEEAFDIDISVIEAEWLTTVGDVLDLVARKAAQP